LGWLKDFPFRVIRRYVKGGGNVIFIQQISKLGVINGAVIPACCYNRFMHKLFSVIVPVKSKARVSDLNHCLNALFDQTLKPGEVIVVISPDAERGLFKLLDKFKRVRVIKKDLTKSQARNYGAKKAKGKYFVHIDANDAPQKNALIQTKRLIETRGARAIMMDETNGGKSLIERARRLERKFNNLDENLCTPQIIEAGLFDRIGGFDEEVDILDDWSLHYRLKNEGVEFFRIRDKNLVNEEKQIKEIVKRKYIRGRFAPILAAKYRDFSKIKPVNRVAVFRKNRQLFLTDPGAAVFLALLKPFEWLVYYIGTLNPVEYNLYKESGIASEYDQKRSDTNFVRYKDYCEKKSLESLLNPPPGSILEIGAGTGRITRFLVQRGYKVTPTEPSGKMLIEYKKKKYLPKALQIEGENISKKIDAVHDQAIAIRVIWHIKNRKKIEKIFVNASSLSSRFLVADLANKNYRLNPAFIIARMASAAGKPTYFKHDYFFTLKEVNNLVKKCNLKIDKKLPLDTCLPVWLNLIPKDTADKIFPYLYRAEKIACFILPPGRWMVRFNKIANQ